MCGDPNSRTPTLDSGDLLAIIHPTPTFVGASLRLSNKAPGATRSTATLTSHSYSKCLEDRLGQRQQQQLQVRIYKFGTPSTSPPSSGSSSYFDTPVPNPVMHTFTLQNTETRQLLCQRLDLGVGGDGVVGRTVSVTGCDGEVLGEGVIGWG